MSSPGLRPAVVGFVLSRTIVLALFVLAGNTRIPEPDVQSGLFEPDIVLPPPAALITRLRETIDVADVGWYALIARDGYENAPFDADDPHNWAFFPLFPLVLRSAMAVTGEAQLTGMALSSLLFLAALFILHAYVRGRGNDLATADRTVLYVALFPTSYFFSLPMTESLFLLLTLSSIFAAERQRWWLSGVLGALASATRVTGVLVLAPLLIIAWLQARSRGWKWTPAIGWLVLVPAGLVAFMLYLSVITGNPFAFRDIQAAWGRSFGLHALGRAALDYVLHPDAISLSWDFKLLNFAAALLALGSSVVLAVRRDWALAAYTLMSVLVPLGSGSLQALGRYVLVLFPIMLVLGWAGRRPLVDQSLRTVFAVLLGLLAALFAAHFTIALA
jgi:hypothetical protein